MEKRILCASLLLLVVFSTKARIHITQKSGYWKDSLTWMDKQVPNNTSSDTFIIRHAVNLQSNLYIY